jgi:prepilin-type processing-associated H-X9-DG protein/prepilin-type N-terminal cleavage/methylation domain-containing protein
MIRRGFTLVELLVVIGIIAVLLAILMPSLSVARQHAITVQCASNMRQIAMGWMLYADANKGAIVPARPPEMPVAAQNVYDIGNGEAWRPRWYTLMGSASGMLCFTNYSAVQQDPSVLQDGQNRQLITNRLFVCPAEPEWVSSRHTTYGYNHQFLGNARNKLKTDKGAVNPIRFPVKISRVNGSQTVMFADSMGTAAGKPASQRLAYNVNGDRIDVYAMGNHGFTMDPPRLTPNSDRCDDNHRQDENRSAPDPRHRGKANVAFCDGHVEAMTLEDLGYVINADGSIPAAGAGAHNRLFSGTGEDLDPPTLD